MGTDLSLYLVTDRSLAKGRPLAAIVEAAIRGGVTAVQYREKDLSTREMIEEAGTLAAICRRLGAIFIVNDRLDVALAVGAGGLHVGQDDMPARMARSFLGSGRLLGVSAGSLEEALRAQADGADYIGASPLFSTPTKPDAGPALGYEGLAAMSAGLTLPVVAIGGIGIANAGAAIEAGASGLAVVSAIVAAEDVEAAARSLRAEIDKAAKGGKS